MPLAGNGNGGNNNGNVTHQMHQHQQMQQQQPPFNSMQSSRNKSRPINLRDLFIAPPFDELDAVATDGTGEPRRLTNSQLKSLRDRG